MAVESPSICIEIQRSEMHTLISKIYHMIHTCMYVYTDVQMYVHIHIYVYVNVYVCIQAHDVAMHPDKVVAGCHCRVLDVALAATLLARLCMYIHEYTCVYRCL